MKRGQALTAPSTGLMQPEGTIDMKIRINDWKTVASWIAGLGLLLFVVGWVLERESAQQMEHNAEHSAAHWAEIIDRTVPDLEAIFAGSRITSAARIQLQHLKHADDVFQFKLFDANGRLVLLSDDIEKPELPRYEIGQDSLGEIRKGILAGKLHIELKKGTYSGRPTIYSEAYAPVLKDGKVIGIIAVFVDQTETDARATNSLIRVAGTVFTLLILVGLVASYQAWKHLLRQRQAEAQVRYMAEHDALSGALNRASFNKVLQRASRHRRTDGKPSFSLLCIDLDHFKEVNDSLGHAAGDQVLRICTQRLKACLREGDQVARLGGDEFAILLMGLSSAAGVTPLAQRIVQALAAPFELADQRVHCGGSVGIAIYGVDGTEPEDLMSKADLALYRAKADGRSTFSFYDIAMDQQMQSRRELTRDLRDAIKAGQMSVHYQPLHGSDGESLVGYEALLRWQHPVRGNVTPAQFIPLAEETGLIDDIGLWVLRRACVDAASWPAPLTVAVNLSAIQFARGNLAEQVTQALADSGLPAERLELEITESLLMNNSEQVMDTLRTLAAMGVSIAMDDFGTGYSSLAYLWRFPFNKVKIDRAFTHNLVQDPKVGMIVRSIITLAHSLDIRVNAEGVETHSQMVALQEHGCDELQGFLLGRPGPAKGLTHIGLSTGQAYAVKRGEARESLFATIPMDLPPVLTRR